MISPTDQQVHCWAWLKNRLPNDSNLTMEDVTWKYTGRKPLKADLVLQPEVTNGVLCCVPINRLSSPEWQLGLFSKQLDESSNSDCLLASQELGGSFPFTWTVRRQPDDTTCSFSEL